MAAPMTYQQYLSTYGIADTPANQARYNLLGAKGAFGAPAPVSTPLADTQGPNSLYGIGMDKAYLDANSPKMGGPSNAIGLQSFAEQNAARARYNAAMNAASGANRRPPPNLYAQNQSPDRTPQGPVQPPAPIPATPAIPIVTAPIQPVNTPGPAPVITMDQPVPSPAKKDETGKNLAKIAATAMGGLGDAFSARAAALAGRSFTPEQTMQNKQLEFQGEQNAADRAQTMQLQARNAALQTNIAQLQAKTQLTEADKNNLAAMQREQAQIAAELRRAIIEKGGLPGADSLGIR